MKIAAYDRFEIVGRYALYGEIASGSSATVLIGRLLGPVGLSRAVAVKRLSPSLARDPRVRSVFMEEARAVSRIRHANVVPTLDVVSADRELLVVSEYVHGESVAQLARDARERRQRVPLPVALAIVIDLLHGLQAAHEARSEGGVPLGIVHRAVSPENVIVGVDGTARVLDFGAGRAIERLERYEESGVKRKLAYMAPEQLAEAPVTAATDVYGAAVVLWELLAGRRLFVRDDRAPTVLLDKLMHGPIERPSTYNPSLPDALDAIVLHALSRKPASRFGSTRQMAAAIEALGECATRTEVGDWVERSAYATLRARSIELSQLDEPTIELPMRIPSTYDVDVLLDAPVEESPPSSEPPPMIAASDTYPVTDARTLRFVRPTPNLPIVPRRAARRVPWTAILGVAAAAVVGVAGGRALTATIDRREAERAPLAAAFAVASPRAPVCPTGMVEVAAGAFVMGADDGFPFERPAHVVRVAPFCIDRFETTTRDYVACADRGQCAQAATTNAWSGMTDRDRHVFDPLCNARDTAERANHPINCVDWEAAAQACRARGARLPTEAEWELAARGTDARKYPWGDDEPRGALLNTCDRACAAWGKKSGLDLSPMFDGDDGFATTSPVGAFSAGASPYGAEDMAGNVSEWVGDYYGDYPSDTRSDPTGPATGVERVVRGGAWNGSLSAWARPTFRTKDPPKNRSFALGFRCSRTQGRSSLAP